MQYSPILTALFLGLTMASPLTERQDSYIPCSGTYDMAQCCSTDILGVADLDCANPPSLPTNATDFSSICAAIGQRARCCVLPVADQAILCETPVGVTD